MGQFKKCLFLVSHIVLYKSYANKSSALLENFKNDSCK
jgi:hypothetical protein